MGQKCLNPIRFCLVVFQPRLAPTQSWACYRTTQPSFVPCHSYSFEVDGALITWPTPQLPGLINTGVIRTVSLACSPGVPDQTGPPQRHPSVHGQSCFCFCGPSHGDLNLSRGDLSLTFMVTSACLSHGDLSLFLMVTSACLSRGDLSLSLMVTSASLVVTSACLSRGDLSLSLSWWPQPVSLVVASACLSRCVLSLYR